MLTLSLQCQPTKASITNDYRCDLSLSFLGSFYHRVSCLIYSITTSLLFPPPPLHHCSHPSSFSTSFRPPPSCPELRIINLFPLPRFKIHLRIRERPRLVRDLLVPFEEPFKHSLRQRERGRGKGRGRGRGVSGIAPWLSGGPRREVYSSTSFPHHWPDIVC